MELRVSHSVKIRRIDSPAQTTSGSPKKEEPLLKPVQ